MYINPYSRIFNPATGRTVNVMSKVGKNVLKGYINELQGGYDQNYDYQDYYDDPNYDESQLGGYDDYDYKDYDENQLGGYDYYDDQNYDESQLGGYDDYDYQDYDENQLGGYDYYDDQDYDDQNYDDQSQNNMNGGSNRIARDEDGNVYGMSEFEPTWLEQIKEWWKEK